MLERGYDRLHVEGWSGAGWEEIARYSGRIDRGRRNLSLEEFAGNPSFRLRFRLESDASGREDGVKIAFVEVSCRSRYWSLSGTSMAAPHVAGAASLLAAHFPGADPVELKARLLSSADRRRAFHGIVASDGRLNVARALTAADVRAPNTEIMRLDHLGRRVRAKLRSSEPLSRFRCRLDEAAWAPCRPLHKTRALAPGRHVIRAAAADYFGNEDPTPAIRRFRIAG